MLTADYREPSGLLAVAAAEGEGAALAGGASGAERQGWYPFIRRFREVCLFPPPEFRAVFHDLRMWESLPA